jgi:hypothetical protein
MDLIFMGGFPELHDDSAILSGGGRRAGFDRWLSFSGAQKRMEAAKIDGCQFLILCFIFNS